MNTELVPVWNGTMEHDGKAPGLSAYQGRSSIFHSANWEKLDALEHGEANGDAPTRGPDRKTRLSRKHDPARDVEVAAMLRQGVSYGAIAKALGCSLMVPRRVARLHGIDRSIYGGRYQAQHGARRSAA